MDINSIINPKHTSPEAIKAWRDKFDNAVPYRHIVIEDFFNDDVADKLYNNFPQIDSLNVKRKSLNENKSEDYHFDRWDPIFSEVREVIKSEEWCKIIAHTRTFKSGCSTKGIQRFSRNAHHQKL